MVKVLFFAHLKDEAGQEEISIEGNGFTVAQVKDKIAADLGIATLDSVMTAVNEEFANDETIVSEGDTVAFIPPVSGG
ncbi:molybdopterin converting factor subunit 1 [Peribacillus glennii]|uniref:Molybdopterin synthase sulfur carrier subunit n=1 Tax=Peribacillus glennii TaxID=2303991 RepID=A0A372L9W8_9BACI|nr:molybdopterin converting factor subunit 1 [Peribacillus glennii]RFU62384.1 molybdopterin converting factor subunit 1 [Peribacillus glennii]